MKISKYLVRIEKEIILESGTDYGLTKSKVFWHKFVQN